MLLKVFRCLDKLAPSEEIGPKKKVLRFIYETKKRILNIKVNEIDLENNDLITLREELDVERLGV